MQTWQPYNQAQLTRMLLGLCLLLQVTTWLQMRMICDVCWFMLNCFTSSRYIKRKHKGRKKPLQQQKQQLAFSSIPSEEKLQNFHHNHGLPSEICKCAFKPSLWWNQCRGTIAEKHPWQFHLYSRSSAKATQAEDTSIIHKIGHPQSFWHGKLGVLAWDSAGSGLRTPMAWMDLYPPTYIHLDNLA